MLLEACGTGTESSVVPGADRDRGRELIERYGCGSCHAIDGVEGADGRVGPPLTNFEEKRYIAGRLPATPPNVMRWIRDPQAIEPETIMPDLGVSERDVRDIVAYLYGQ